MVTGVSAFGAIGGAVGSATRGGDFLDGLRNGLTSGLLNHVAHEGLNSISNIGNIEPFKVGKSLMNLFKALRYADYVTDELNENIALDELIDYPELLEAGWKHGGIFDRFFVHKFKMTEDVTILIARNRGYGDPTNSTEIGSVSSSKVPEFPFEIFAYDTNVMNKAGYLISITFKSYSDYSKIFDYIQR